MKRVDRLAQAIEEILNNDSLRVDEIHWDLSLEGVLQIRDAIDRARPPVRP